MYDELQLDTLGDKKTALFLIMSDTDSTFNFLISMVYTQLFNLLCDKADDVYGGKLPIHVRCLIDECANIGQIFKTAISVWMISNTFDIIMAVFDVTQQVVSDSSGIIAGNARVNDIGLSMLQSSLMQMDVGPLFGLFLQSFFIGITMRILSIIIFVIVYGNGTRFFRIRWAADPICSTADCRPVAPMVPVHRASTIRFRQKP